MYTKASSQGSLFRTLCARVRVVFGVLWVGVRIVVRVLRICVGPFVVAVLYMLTFGGELLISGGARFCVVYAVSWTAGLFVAVPLGAPALARLAALFPVVWSLVALVLPGTGPRWRRSHGVRRPGVGEEETIRGAFLALGVAAAEVDALCARVWVIDSGLCGSMVRGGAVVVTRGLVRSDALTAALAHELSHLRSADGRLSVALLRFGFWGDPLCYCEDLVESGEKFWVVVTWGVARVVVALGGVRPVCWLLSPFWSLYWRSREYRADAHAVSLGFGEDLLAYLEDNEQELDRPQLGLLRGGYQHPPVALRISRLQESLGLASRRRRFRFVSRILGGRGFLARVFRG